MPSANKNWFPRQKNEWSNSSCNGWKISEICCPIYKLLQRFEEYLLQYKKDKLAHVILKITTSGGEEETSFVAPGETINLLLPRGLGLVDLVATGLKNPTLAEVLENPSVEIADRISHRNVVSIENQGGHEFQISGGPTLCTKTIDWQPLTIDSNFDMSAKINLLPIMVSHTPDAGDKIARFARNNKAILITSAVFGVAGAVVLPIASPLLGFGAGGVAAGSIAASAQSVIYG